MMKMNEVKVKSEICVKIGGTIYIYIYIYIYIDNVKLEIHNIISVNTKPLFSSNSTLKDGKRD